MDKLIFGQRHKNKQFTLTLRNVVLIFCLFCCCFNLFLCSCVGMSDWEYELPNNYSVTRLNASTINIYNDNALGGPVIDNYVTRFAYNERFVCARRLVLDDDKRYFSKDIMAMDFEQAVYCIIDTQTHDVYDLLNKDEFDLLCKELEIENLCDWIDTYPKPKGAK